MAIYQRHPVEVEQHLYRLVQQALANAHQHAQATMIRVDGRLSPDQLCLEIVDDGVGFSPAEGLDVSSLVASFWPGGNDGAGAAGRGRNDG